MAKPATPKPLDKEDRAEKAKYGRVTDEKKENAAKHKPKGK